MIFATLLYKTKLWYIVTYMRGVLSYINDNDYVKLLLPKTYNVNDGMPPERLYLYYWFSDMIQNCRVFNINFFHGGQYWYKPTMAVLKLSFTYDEYFNNVIKSKERALIRRAEKNGFYCKQIEYDGYISEILEINSSKIERGGKAMSYDYLNLKPRDSIIKPYNSHVYTYGCFNSNDKLVAYYMFEKITNFFHTIKGIGHADYLNMGIMNYLFANCVADLTSKGLCEYLLYGTVDNHSGGLSRFKRQCGCKCKHVFVSGSVEDFNNLKYFNKTYNLHGDTALNFVLDYVPSKYNCINNYSSLQ